MMNPDQEGVKINISKPLSIRSSGIKTLNCALLGAIAAVNTVQVANADPIDSSRDRAQIEEVVVTASRRTDSLQSTPVSMVAISGDDLANQGIVDFKDITRLVPGLHLEKRSSTASQSIKIRGVGIPPGGTQDSSVGVTIDGVYQVRPGFVFSELLDVERVEVLRGPQGTMFGRNTTSGVISIQTASPDTDEISGHIQFVGGNLDNKEGRGYLNLPLVDGKLALRVSAYVTDQDGHVKNPYLGNDIDSQEKKGARVKLLWKADQFQAEWSTEVGENKGVTSGARVTYGNDNIVSASRRPDLAGQPWETIANALGKSLTPIGLGKYAQDFNDEFEDKHQRHILKLDIPLGSHSLQSISAYEEFDSFTLQDRDQTMLALAGVSNDNSTISWSQELILSSDWSGSWDYILGVFFQRDTLDSPSVLFDGPDLYALGAAVEGTPSILNSTQKDSENKAVFGNIGYQIADGWKIRLGARYTEDEKSQYSSMDLPGLPTVVAINDSRKFYDLTWTAKIEHTFENDNLVYLSADRGFKSGGFNRQNTACALSGGRVSCLSPDLLNYDEETTQSVELGVKSTWFDKQLRVNGALFYQIFDDFQAVELVQSEGLSLVRNAAEVKSFGLEVDMLALLGNNFTLNGSAAWVRTEYGDFSSAPCATPDSSGCFAGVQDLTGKQLDGAPMLTANLGGEYRSSADSIIKSLSGFEIFTRVDAAFRSDTNLDVAQSHNTHQSSYLLMSARVGVESNDQKWKMTIWGNNLFNKDYSISARENIAGVSHFKGLPRTWGATVDYRF